ncbi:MAG: hypothetical protein HY919_00550 [Elusimicrobia bacterium]|nr:hypothetical protein [Elusimicrobiota bacterium]
MKIYYEHDKHRFDNFYFDGGGKINKKLVSNNPKGAYELFDYKNNNYSKLKIKKSNKYYPKNATISFPQGSQGIITFAQQYKIVWRTKYAAGFQFCDWEILLDGNQSLTISSNNKQEILYLLSLLNSIVIKLIIEKNLKSEGEQAFFIAITSVKQYVRVPKITKENQFIKDEIIKRTEEMLFLEEKTLSDFIDFSDVMLQKFDDVEIDDSNLILKHNGDKIKLKIKSNTKLVSETIQKELKEELKLENKKINLADLKNLPVIDFDKQKQIKDYIDALVFALYFNVPINEISPNKSDDIKNLCSKNKYYQIVNNIGKNR